MKSRSIFNPFYWPALLIGFVKDVVAMVYRHMETSIRLQLMFAVGLCLGAAVIASAVTSPFFANVNKSSRIEYTQGIEQIDRQTRNLLYMLEDASEAETRNGGSAVSTPMAGSGPAPETYEQKIARIIDQERWDGLKTLIVDLDGKVLYRTANASESQVDIHGIIRNAMSKSLVDIRYRNQEYVSFYPLNMRNNGRAYLVVSGMPQPEIVTYKETGHMPVFVGVVVFIVCFFLLTKRKMKTIEELAGGLMEITRGNLGFRFGKKGKDELGTLAERVNEMTVELQKTIEEERLAQKTKNELITNVSHDLRTPLTLVMGYLRLLKDRSYENEQQADAYLQIAFTKAEKLKSLIDDLFEYTKLTNRGNQLNIEKVCVNELLGQLVEEHVTRAEANQLSLNRIIPAERIWVELDPDQMIRVFDNLLTNAINYSTKPGTIKCVLFADKGHAFVCISNQGTPIPQAELNRLFERFYRLDTARSSESGGSGLGLAIAKSIIDLHGGRIWAECEGEEIRFWVKLKMANANAGLTLLPPPM